MEDTDEQQALQEKFKAKAQNEAIHAFAVSSNHS
jgi:hypothetical protein